jgi:hypothetical protein
LQGRLFASYQLWSQFEPAIDRADTHCQMQRGWRWVQDTGASNPAKPKIIPLWQQIGKLAQRAIYEFHQEPLLLKHRRGIDRLADRLYLSYQIPPIRSRVMAIIERYQQEQWLTDTEIILLTHGDEPPPPPLSIASKNICFDLYFAFDCIVKRSLDTLEIIEFKTGRQDFDRRQAYVYLLAASYLYPQYHLRASFLNLETGATSEIITATPAKLRAIASKLAHIAHDHHQQIISYHRDPHQFDRLFPPNPSHLCRVCPFDYLCQYGRV